MNHIDKKRQAGFTLVEVMIAIGIMTVGSLGILAMHQGVGQANRAALEMNTALAITERWIERVDRDALSWNKPGLNSISLLGTDYLTGLAGTVSATDWFRPTPPPGESYDFDFFGDDVTLGNPNPPKYCTNLRLSWLRQGSSARVDIRTFWYREGYMRGGATHPNWVGGSTFRGADCDAATADGWGLNTATLPPNIDVVFASTVVTWQRREGT
ncbi:MAG: prepilin-type N-terminal cleavage/methylation domain-containing protein [Polyangiales bacterium]